MAVKWIKQGIGCKD